MTKVYGYCRVSTEEQAFNGYSIPAQIEELKRYKDHVLSDVPWADIAVPDGAEKGFGYDLGVSAWSKPFWKRPAGKIIREKLEPGDHLLIWKVDRGFRNLLDFCKTVPYWLDEGINIHFTAEQFNLGTANGMFLANMAAAYAQWSSDIRSERTREGLAQMKRKRRAAYKPKKTGTKSTRRDNYKSWVSSNKRKLKTQKDLPRGKMYTYCRKSAIKCGEYTIEAQRKKVNDHCKYLLGLPGYEKVKRGCHMQDINVSAFRVNFRKRPGGQKLMGLLQKGDHIVVPRIDRTWRSVQDMTDTYERLKEKGVTLHLADCMIDTGTPAGLAFMQMMTVMAEWESRDTSERTKIGQHRSKLTRGVWVHALRTSWSNPAVDWQKLISHKLVRTLRDKYGLCRWRIQEYMEWRDAYETGRPRLPNEGIDPVRQPYYHGWKTTELPRTRVGRMPPHKGKILPFWTEQRVNKTIYRDRKNFDNAMQYMPFTYEDIPDERIYIDELSELPLVQLRLRESQQRLAQQATGTR